MIHNIINWFQNFSWGSFKTREQIEVFCRKYAINLTEKDVIWLFFGEGIYIWAILSDRDVLIIADTVYETKLIQRVPRIKFNQINPLSIKIHKDYCGIISVSGYKPIPFSLLCVNTTHELLAKLKLPFDGVEEELFDRYQEVAELKEEARLAEEEALKILKDCANNRDGDFYPYSEFSANSSSITPSMTYREWKESFNS
jgi:hypothetical protein